jgi:ATP-dependent Clp protease protease subunit
MHSGFRKGNKDLIMSKTKEKPSVISTVETKPLSPKECISCKTIKNVKYQGPKCVNCYKKETNPQTLETIKLYQKNRIYTVNDRYNKGKTESKLRKIRWNLSKEDYIKLNSKPCFYCGGNLPLSGVGLDRLSLDKKIGYSIDNVVPCCSTCSSIRGDKLSVIETINALSSIKESRNLRIEQIFHNGYDVEGRTIFMFNEITEESASNYLKGLELMEKINPFAPVTVKIMSNGGDFYSGLAFYDALVNSHCPKIMIGTGMVASTATIIFQAGDQRQLTANCRFLIHDGTQEFDGQPKSLESWSKESKRARQMMYDIYSKKSKKDSSFWEKECSKDTVYTAQEAVKLGLADKVLGEEDDMVITKVL